MVRFSKFFFFLFTLLTICPLLALFGWNRYQLAEFMNQRQENSLASGAEWITKAYSQYLQEEELYFDRILNSFSNQTLTIDQYQTLFDTDDVTEQPFTPYQRKAKVDYVLVKEPKTQRLFPRIRFIIPVKAAGDKAIIIQKRIPYQNLSPPGPYVVSLYAGGSKAPTDLLETLQDSHISHVLPAGKMAMQSVNGRWVMENAKTRDFTLEALDGSPIMTVILKSPLLMQIQKEQEQIGFWLTVIILFSGCLSSLLAAKYLNKNFIEPLVILSVATGKVKRGQRNVQIDTTTIKHPDVSATLENFNEMIQQLEEKENLKKNFISTLTHDLRTPLIAQERTLDLLIRKIKRMSPEEQESFFISLSTNNQHLLGMVNQILETYQFEEGKIRLYLQKVEIKQIVAFCFEQLQLLANERNIQLISSIPEDLAPFNADSQCLLRVFNNLVGNAIENTPRGSRVEVSAFHKDNMVEIHVRDNGLGIPEAQRKQLFERYTGGYGDTRKIGTGLGLYICKMFIEAHQGSISVDSQPGQYTDFRIELPTHLQNEEVEAR